MKLKLTELELTAVILFLVLMIGVGAFMLTPGHRERCESMYESEEDIGECVWILENGQ
jgi:hypothetical protein